MGLETALVVGGLSIASGIGQYNQAKSNARATARQGERAIENRDLNDFFDEKANQSDEVAGWSEASVKKLKNVYIRNLVDAGLLEDAKNRNVKNT